MTQRRAQITGWGKCVPPVKLTNADLELMVETSDQWIVERTGMKERGISHVEVTDLAEVAALVSFTGGTHLPQPVICARRCAIRLPPG